MFIHTRSHVNHYLQLHLYLKKHVYLFQTNQCWFWHVSQTILKAIISKELLFSRRCCYPSPNAKHVDLRKNACHLWTPYVYMCDTLFKVVWYLPLLDLWVGGAVVVLLAILNSTDSTSTSTTTSTGYRYGVGGTPFWFGDDHRHATQEHIYCIHVCILYIHIYIHIYIYTYIYIYIYIQYIYIGLLSKPKAAAGNLEQKDPSQVTPPTIRVVSCSNNG